MEATLRNDAVSTVGPSDAAIAAMLSDAMSCGLRWAGKPGDRLGSDGLVGVRAGEIIRCVIVVPRGAMMRPARLCLNRAIEQFAGLYDRIVEDTSCRLTVRRDDGHHIFVDIISVEGAQHNVRGTWLTGVVFYDSADMGDWNGILDAVRAASARLVPGGAVRFSKRQ